MNDLQVAKETASMPVPTAVDSKHVTDNGTAARHAEKGLDYFRSEFEKATLAFYRSTKKVADLLMEARLTLSPEDFEQLINEVQFDYSTVRKLIKSAADFRLNDPKNQALLPESWTLRYEIMMMEETTFRIGVTKGIIHSGCTLADLKKLREQLETPKRKKASATAEPKGKDSTAVATAETATPAPAKVEEPEPKAKNAAVKAPVNNPGLRVVDSGSAAECAAAVAAAPAMATATAAALAKGRIALVVSQGILNQHKADLGELLARIEALVKDYEFIGGVELEVAA